MLKSMFLFLLPGCAAAFGQIVTGSPSVTVTATLGQNVPPDQVSFTVTVQSSSAVALDDVLGALQGTGLSASNFSSVSSVNQYDFAYNPANQGLIWSFQLAVPLANIKSQMAAFQSLAASLSQGQIPLNLSYTVSGPQVSAKAQVQSCTLADLVSSARSKAQQIAGAANRSAGSVAALSSSVSTMIGSSATTPYVIPACSLTATFGPPPPDGKSITVAASRTINVAPDTVTFVVYVNTQAGSSLDDALAQLAGLGLGAGNLQNVYVNSQVTPFTQQWQFSFSVPFSKMKDTNAALQKIASSTVTFWVQGTQISSQLQAAQDCSYASLLADAQAQARQVTAAAGVALNDVISISDSGSSTAVPASRLGDFVGAVYTVVNPFYSQSPTCSLVAKFGIGQ